MDFLVANKQAQIERMGEGEREKIERGQSERERKEGVRIR